MVKPRQLANGKWQARHYLGGGKYAALGTYEEYEDALKAQLRHELGIEPDKPAAPIREKVVRGQIKFGKYAEDLLAARKSSLASGTWHLYTWVLQRHLIPEFGTRKLSEISPHIVRSWWASLPEGSGRRNAYVVLLSTMRQAVEDSEISTNPVRIKGAAQDASKPRPTFTPGDAQMLMDMAGEGQLRVQIQLLLSSGMRAGELLGLNRDDVDLVAETVTVRRHLTRHELASGTKAHKHAVRVLTVSRVALSALQRHLEATPGHGADPLFKDARGGRMSYHTLSKKWVALRASVGLEHMHLHDIRHVHSTEYAKRATLAEGMARTGHTDVRSYMRYQHATQERDREIIAAMEGVL